MPQHAFEEGSRLRAIKTAVGVRPFSGPAGPSGLASTMRMVGAVVVAKMQAAFVEQRRGRVEWPGRSVPNVFGIIADLTEGRSPPARRFEARKAGIDRGDLYRSLAFAVVGEDTVVCGSNRPYADNINEGGKVESKPITETVKKNLHKFLYSDKAKSALTVLRKAAKQEGNRNFYGNVPRAQAVKDMKTSLGWLFNKKFHNQRLTAVLPARPFTLLEDDDYRDIQREVGVVVTRAG